MGTGCTLSLKQHVVGAKPRFLAFRSFQAMLLTTVTRSAAPQAFSQDSKRAESSATWHTHHAVDRKFRSLGGVGEETEVVASSMNSENANSLPLGEEVPNWPNCGVMSQDGTVSLIHRDMEVGAAKALLCNRLVLTNCSSTEEIALLCPAPCPYLELSAYSSFDAYGNRLPCGTACVTAEQCGDYRPDLSFPNPRTSMCESCPSDGCQECGVFTDAQNQSSLQCTRCRDGFTLGQNGLCSYNLDSYIVHSYYFIGIVFAALILVALVLNFTCHRNAEALQKGLEHRERCLPHDVQTSARVGDSASRQVETLYSARAPLFPLSVNVHAQNIVGVGLALYYNHLVFIAIIAAGSFLTLHFMESFLGVGQWDALQCGYGSGSHSTEEVVVAYARRRALIAMFLWAAVLPASIIFARWQASAARTFDRVHTRMEDYTFALRNLPPDATDPVELQRWVEDKFGGVKIEGVSIGYDYCGHERAVRELLDEHLRQAEDDFRAALGVPGSSRSRRRLSQQSGHLPVVQESETMMNSTPENDGIKAVLAQLPCSGEAFVVMKQEADAEKFFTMWDQPRGLQRTGSFFSLQDLGDLSPSMTQTPKSHSSRKDRLFRGQELELREITSEPTAIVWEHMGIPHRNVLLRSALAALIFILVASMFYSLLYYPLFHYVLRYARKAGKPPSGFQASGLGALIGAGNNLIANFIWIGVPRLGFKRKDQADIVTFAVRTLLVLCNTIALVLLTSKKLSAVGQPEEGILDAAGATLSRTEELAQEALLADAVLRMFITGNFASYVLFFFSYPLTLWQAAFVIRTGIMGSSMSSRDCERLLEPMEIWLPWDYASHIQLTCCAFFPLFLVEPPGFCASRVLCAVLLLWCGVMYCAQRIIHLRASKVTNFSTSRLDTSVLVGWALPIGQLAVTSASWLARALKFELMISIPLCCLAFVVSCGLYWVLLHQALKHQKNITYLYATKSEPYQSALARLRYSYFNTNPIHVLRAPEFGLKRTCWYEAGKAYLQADDPKQDAQLEATRALAEHAEESQSQPQSFGSRLLYQARVWFLGTAPEHAYQAVLDAAVE